MPECPTCHRTFPTKHAVWQHWMQEHKPPVDIIQKWENRRTRKANRRKRP